MFEMCVLNFCVSVLVMFVVLAFFLTSVGSSAFDRFPRISNSGVSSSAALFVRLLRVSKCATCPFLGYSSGKGQTWDMSIEVLLATGVQQHPHSTSSTKGLKVWESNIT